MFDKILIANRGEIALRIINACKEIGIATVAVYSEEDVDSLHVRFADEDICIGPPESSESYLNMNRIISAAEITDADAIHPGYGYLAENPDFADICEDCGITFIGPSSKVMRSMGDKAMARRIAQKVGVPVVPGSEGIVESHERAGELAKEIGFPVILKAVAGGGGRGMRIVNDPEQFSRNFLLAHSEAESAFGCGDLYLEKYLTAPRHIEVQVYGDGAGRVVHLGERECSVQRRHQKLVEESPSPVVDEKLRKKMGDCATRITKEVAYVGAGTVEFLLDEDGKFYFMEMNTRIQVEHPVTEMVTGFDLVKEQIRVAAGEPLSFPEKNLRLRGHAIECRINAEDPETFYPSPGTIHSFHLPGGPGVRVDTAAHQNCRVSPYYDSLLAKIIAHGRDRREAISRMLRCLETTVIEGIRTTIPLHAKILTDPDFVEGNLSTGFMERFMKGNK